MILGAVYMREEDPYRKRNNFTLSLHAEISVRMVPKYRRFEKELKMAGDKNKHAAAVWALPLSLRALIITFLQNYDNNTLVVTLNEMACFVPSTRILLVTHKRVVPVVSSVWVLSALIALLTLKWIQVFGFIFATINVACYITTGLFYCKIYAVIRHHVNQINNQQQSTISTE